MFKVDREVEEIVRRAAYAFEEAGAEVVPVHFKFRHTADEYAKMWLQSISIDTSIDIELWKRNGFDLIGDHADELPEEFIEWNEKTAEGGILDYYEFNCARTELMDAFENVFEWYDLILSPTTACLPVLNAKDGNTLGPRELNGQPVNPLIGYCETFFANFTCHPAASVPAGLSESGLPVGLQIIGKRFCDGDVLAASHTFEQLRPWRDLYRIPFSRAL